MLGATGAGKTNFLTQLIREDINTGRGLAVLAREDDWLRTQLMPAIPEARLDDVVYFNPADIESPVTFNPLAAAPGDNVGLKVDETFAVFKRVLAFTGARMEPVLRHTLRALLDRPGSTLEDVIRLLDRDDATLRSEVIRRCSDEFTVRFFKQTYPRLPRDAFEPIVLRIGRLLDKDFARAALCNPRSSLNFRDVMDQGKIVLFNLSDGLLGAETSQLIGSLLVSTFQLAVMSRADTQEAKRRPFTLYLDEFHTFTEGSAISYEMLLSRARKYGLSLVLAHQQTGQLTPELLREILGNVATIVCFDVGHADAQRIAREIAPGLDAEALQRRPVGQAHCRIDRTHIYLHVPRATLGPDIKTQADEKTAQVVARSRERWGVRRASKTVSATEREHLSGRAAPTPGGAADVAEATVAGVAEALTTPTPTTAADPPAAGVAEAEPRPALPGRGGRQHKFLQDHIKRIAEERGFRATIEKRVLSGHGHVDVSIEGAGYSIACEISITTRADHEVQNLVKCLVAGFDYAVLLSSDARTLRDARALLADDPDERVRFMGPEDLSNFLEQLAEAPRVANEVPVTEQDGSKAPSSPPPTKRLMSAKEAAAYLGLAAQTLAKMRVIGGSPTFFKIGRQVMYDRADLDRWLEERRRRSTSDPG